MGEVIVYKTQEICSGNECIEVKQPAYFEVVLRPEYDKKCAELDEQLRINGIGQERELKLMAEIESLKKRLLDFENSIPVDDVRALIQAIKAADSGAQIHYALEKFTAKHGSKLNKER